MSASMTTHIDRRPTTKLPIIMQASAITDVFLMVGLLPPENSYAKAPASLSVPGRWRQNETLSILPLCIKSKKSSTGSFT